MNVEFGALKLVLVAIIGATTYALTADGLSPEVKLAVGALHGGATALLAYTLKPPTPANPAKTAPNPASDDREGGA